MLLPLYFDIVLSNQKKLIKNVFMKLTLSLSLFCLVLLQGCNPEDKFDYQVVEGNGRIALTFDDTFVKNWNSVKKCN